MTSLLLAAAIFCSECSSELPAHAGPCSQRPPVSAFYPRRKKAPKAPKPFTCCGGLMACAETCPERCKVCGAARGQKHDSECKWGESLPGCEGRVSWGGLL